MSNTKDFSTLAIATVTSRRFLIRPASERDNGIGELYQILGWMTDDEPFTHQLPRFADECRPWLNRWFPDLAAIDDEIVRRCEAGEVQTLQDDIERRFGKTRSVGKIPRDDHDVKNPIAELVDMVGAERVLVINPPTESDDEGE